MTNCKNMDCPWRSNSTSNLYHCDIFPCQRRDDGTVLIASNHTLTKDELMALRRADNG